MALRAYMIATNKIFENDFCEITKDVQITVTVFAIKFVNYFFDFDHIILSTRTRAMNT